jgi:hypothetical protein
LATYEFHFTETPTDALEAYDAVRTATTQMRAWARFLMAAYGLMFVAGLGLALAKPAEVHWWQFAIWLAMGSGISWQFIVKPAFIRNRLRSVPTQAVWVELSDAGIMARVADKAAVQKYWGELATVLAARKGLAIGFRDGAISWLPQRAFRSPALKAEVELFIKSKLPKVDEAA